MLVLSRRKGEDIIIGHNIRICVIEATGNRVKIGIVAPPDIPILRSELVTHTIDRVAEPPHEMKRLNNHLLVKPV